MMIFGVKSRSLEGSCPNCPYLAPPLVTKQVAYIPFQNPEFFATFGVGVVNLKSSGSGSGL